MSTRETPSNPHIHTFSPYSPGRPIEEVARQYGLNPRKILKLASNENLFGPSPKALMGVRAALKSIHLYPDTLCTPLLEKLSGELNLPRDQIYVGNGGVEILFDLARAYLLPGDEVIMGHPSFGAFYIGAAAVGAKIHLVPLKNFHMDLEGMSRAINSRTKIVYIVNPNNPTGTMTPNAAVANFMKKVPEEVLVLLDEAYWSFAEAEGYKTGLEFARRGANVLVLRSLSKHLGIAGLRVGYAFGRAAIIRNLVQVHLPFHVNSLAQAAAYQGIEDHQFIATTIRRIGEAREFFKQELRRRKISFAPSATNFIYIRIDGDDAIYCRELEKRGVIVRPGSTFRDPGYIRVTLGPDHCNRRFFQVFDEVRQFITGQPPVPANPPGGKKQSHNAPRR